MAPVHANNGDFGVLCQRVDQPICRTSSSSRNCIPVLLNKNCSPCHPGKASCGNGATGELRLVLQQLVEVGNGVFETFAELDLWFPTQQLAGLGNVGLSLRWVVNGQVVIGHL